ncbi:unnamed protein product [Brassica oleracea var. botrytis]
MASMSAFPVFPLRCFSGNSHFRIAVLISRRVSAVGWVSHCAGQALREPMFCLCKAKALGTEKMQTKQSSCSAKCMSSLVIWSKLYLDETRVKSEKSLRGHNSTIVIKETKMLTSRPKSFGGRRIPCPSVVSRVSQLTRSLMMVRYLIKTGELIPLRSGSNLGRQRIKKEQPKLQFPPHLSILLI